MIPARVEAACLPFWAGEEQWRLGQNHQARQECIAWGPPWVLLPSGAEAVWEVMFYCQVNACILWLPCGLQVTVFPSVLLKQHGKLERM